MCCAAAMTPRRGRRRTPPLAPPPRPTPPHPSLTPPLTPPRAPHPAPDPTKQEEAALAQLAGSLEGTLQFADHIDKVLTDRADMFLKMRDGLRVLKEKARAAAYPKPNGGAAPAALD